MVVKGGKRNEKETASLVPSGKKKMKQKGGKEEKKWRKNWSLNRGAEMVVKGGKQFKKKTASLKPSGKRKKKQNGETKGIMRSAVPLPASLMS